MASLSQLKTVGIEVSISDLPSSGFDSCYWLTLSYTTLFIRLC